MRTIVLAALAYGLAARLFEMVRSAHNAKRVLARGGRRVEPDGFAGLAAVHAAWFAGMFVEELLLGATVTETWIVGSAWVVFVLSEALRYVCIATLGDRWNVRVVIEDGAPRVRRGVYRVLKHPNYLAATVGIGALPLALGLPFTALVCLPLKVGAVVHRRRLEERQLVAAEAGSRSPGS